MVSRLKHIAFVLALFLIVWTPALAQRNFQTIVTPGPVVVGESFQVQYVLEDIDKENEFFAPDFKDFRFVSGPNIYSGTAYGAKGPRKLRNIVYTLAATSTGQYIIPGASARIDNRLVKSESVLLRVISRAEANIRRKLDARQEVNEAIYLHPGEDPYEKIRRNLFMKVLVDKQSCFVGEPVTAVFKLYSRLDSQSDIVKNPGFYGFTVQDVINLQNRATSKEIINGKHFDVHIVRKVQLYPLQAGTFNIDAMEVRNKVRFSKSEVNRKAEQEIQEGIIPGDEPKDDEAADIYENQMSTGSVAINVKPVPEKNKPVHFSGATGQFKMAASVNKDEFSKNEEGDLVITISGQGNFTQLSAPVIQWPDGIEGFEPSVVDSLDHMHSPMAGKREFHFRFISSRPGDYKMAGVEFSFFNPDTNQYRTLSTHSLAFHVSKFEKARAKLGKLSESQTHGSRRFGGWWLWTIAAAISAATAAAILFSRKRLAKNAKKSQEELTANKPVAVQEFLQPALTFSGADSRTFYTILRNCIWDFFASRFDLSGRQLNKHTLSTLVHQGKIREQHLADTLDFLAEAETGSFTAVEDFGDKTKLLADVKRLLDNIDSAV